LTLSESLDEATERFLNEGRSPSRVVNELDNRGSHFYLALYWAEALARQKRNTDLNIYFDRIAKMMEDNQEKILQDLLDAQGSPVDIGGYYFPDEELTKEAMRPSEKFNGILNTSA
ncbi:MAG: NADP-dependent isocitrate dehydrogenase, partial [Christiangramia sp.]|nr:NADP-dependent isocitrate dehydrogenase [Christiangramia sp.]